MRTIHALVNFIDTGPSAIEANVYKEMSEIKQHFQQIQIEKRVDKCKTIRSVLVRHLILLASG